MSAHPTSSTAIAARVVREGGRNIADRLAALGGRLEVGSAPGQGTTITATPCHLSCTQLELAHEAACARLPGARGEDVPGLAQVVKVHAS